MRVLQLISSAGHYGAESVVLNLSTHLNRIGATSTVGVFNNAHLPNLEIAEDAKSCGLEVEVIPCSGRIDWKTVQTLRTIIKRRKIDVLHTHGYKAHAYGYLAVKSPKLPERRSAQPSSCALVATCHGYHSRMQQGSARYRQKVYSATELTLLRRFDRVVSVSSKLADFLRHSKVSSAKVMVITNGIDLDGFASATPSPDLQERKAGKLAIGIVSRLIEQKGHSELFEATKSMILRHPNTIVFVVGDGPLRQVLETQVHELDIASNVVFTGKRDDMAGVYAALDVSVLPSHNEGMPMSILEALAANRAVVASNVGSIAEVIHNEKTGLLMEPKDVVGLRDALERLISSRDLRESLGANGAALVREHFSADYMATQYLSTYEGATC